MTISRHLRPLRRILLVGGLFAMGLALSMAVSRPAEAVVIPTYAYLSAGDGHYVHVIDDATKTRTTTIGPFNANSNWRCNRMTAYGTPDGSRVFQTATCQANAVSINTATNAYTTMSWAGTAASFSPDSQYIYVTQAYYRNAYKVSDGSNVWGAMSPCYRPYSTQWSMATSQDGSKIYIPYQGSCSNPVATFNQVDVLDAATGATLGAITDANLTSPTWTMAAPTGNRIYVGSNGYINVINSNTDAVVASWPIGSNSPVAVSEDGSRVYVATGTVVKKLDATDGSEITSYPVSTGEGGISLNPAGTHLYVLANNGADLSIIRLSDGNITTINLPAGQASRTISWGKVMPAPDIALSASSGTAYTGEAVSLYTVTNSGGTGVTYSITPSVPSGLSFSSSTGRISGTPSATQAATTYTITATNSGGTSNATFTLTITNPPPTTTTTTTTTVSPATTVATDSGAAGGGGTGSGATPTGGTGNVKNSTGTTSTTIALSSTSTSVSPSTTTTTTTIPAPDAPDVKPGESSATIDGETVSVEVTRLDNSVVLSGAGISASISGLSTDGTKIALSEDGTLRLEEGDRIVVEATGYAADDDVEVWMFSTPHLLGTVKVDATGRFANNFDLPIGIPSGEHRLVLKGRTDVGQDIVLGLGIRVGSDKSTSTVTRWLIALPVALAIGLGLIIPTTLRRRRRES